MEKIAVTPEKIKAYTQKHFKLLIGLILGGILLAFWLGQEKPAPILDKMNEKSPIYDLTKAVEDKSLWLFKAQNQLSEQQKTQEKLTEAIAELKQSLSPSSEVETLKNRIEQLEQKAVSPENTYVSQEPSETNSYFEPYTATEDPLEALPKPNTIQAPFSTSIFSESLTLSAPLQSKLPHKDNFIPPGTYARAVLLNGVDVLAGVSSQTNPKPLLLRLTDRGSLPNGAYSRLKDCRIIAAASGELSSERANIRLEKLSCVQKDGHVIVTDIDGFVSGEDGKIGLRGPMITRDGELLARGFMGGLLSGLGKATTQSYRSTNISPFGAVQVSDTRGVELFKQAGAQGLGDAFELMAKYNIQRAEQYQPVIQISAGRYVDVVFHSGSEFGERKIRKNPTPSPHHELPTQNIYGD